MTRNFIGVVSFQKVRYRNGVPTGELYRNHCWVNVENISYISHTKTSVNLPEHNISFVEEGSKIHMLDGTTIISALHPKVLIADIEKLKNN